MQIGNKLFPYPTINSNTLKSCFKNTSYEFKCEDNNDEQYYTLENVFVNIDNEHIKNLIREGFIGAGLVIECSTTVFRKMYEITLEPKTIKINIGDLKDKVVVSCYLYAKRNIPNYKDNDFLDDYHGYSFEIEKNDIIAIDDGFTTIIDYDESMDKKVASIFQVIRSNSIETMTIEIKARKIVISLPEEEFKYYDTLRKNDNFQNIFFSMLAVPALTYGLKEFQYNILSDQSSLDILEMNYTWFISVKNAYKNEYGCELTEEIFKELDVSILSQKLLNNGVLNGIRDLFNISMRKNYGGEYNE